MQINKLNCFIKDIISKPTFKVNTLQQFQTKHNENFLNLLKLINIQNKDKNNKFVKEGFQDINLNLILQNINQYANKKIYEQNLNDGLNLLIVKHLFLEINYIRTFIKFIVFHLKLINNKFNKLVNFVEKEKHKHR